VGDIASIEVLQGSIAEVRTDGILNGITPDTQISYTVRDKNTGVEKPTIGKIWQGGVDLIVAPDGKLYMT